MTFDLREALWLRDEGFEDILMGYPSTDQDALRELAQRPDGITLMVDLPEHLEMLSQIVSSTGKAFNICVDVDLSMDLPGARFGVFRSQINSEDSMLSFIEKIKSLPHLSLKGLMGYEAQIAGVMDENSPLIRFLKRRSLNQLQTRRKKFVELLKNHGLDMSFVNGGGTGSLLETTTEKVVTEVTVGSGFFSPVLFDHYIDFKLHPALLFTLPVVRIPEKNIYTCLGGGYIASGALEKIKQPSPYLPEGCQLTKHEGAGEVQTPVVYKGDEKIQLGSSIIFRHAKSGEVCERFYSIALIKDDKKMTEELTYRGEGKTFV